MLNSDPSSQPDVYRVLDAGCGAGHAIIDLPANARVVGIDSSAAALSRNRLVDEAIVGDIQTCPVEPSSFDEIVCWDVLEHLPHPDRAFGNLARGLKPGGKLTLGVPNLLSAKGLITRFTPLGFHVWFYRRFFPTATHIGQEGSGPWKTHLRWTIRPHGLVKLAARHGLEVESLTTYEGASLRSFWNRHRTIRLLCRIVWPFADPRLTECKFVARKPV